ncbi:MAG: hypothetical protein GY719_25785 [bacterium]|nr:hypothetical protein [bacterium]
MTGPGGYRSPTQRRKSRRPERITVQAPAGTRAKLAAHGKAHPVAKADGKGSRPMSWSETVSEALRQFWS